MNKYRVEFGFGENFQAVEEWQTTDGLENAMFRVSELIDDGFGGLEPADTCDCQYYNF